MKLPYIDSKDKMIELIHEVGFIPLFDGQIKGFSIQSAKSDGWWSDDPEIDPWMWRHELADDGDIVYGKLIDKRSAFFSREWYGILANYRRDGYDFDSRCNDGLASYREQKIMKLFFEKPDILYSFEIKHQAGFGKEGEKGFEGILTNLQMQCYILNRGMRRRKNKKGFEYGWPISRFSASEALMGNDYFYPYYEEEPKESFERLIKQIVKITGVSSMEAGAFIKL